MVAAGMWNELLKPAEKKGSLVVPVKAEMRFTRNAAAADDGKLVAADADVWRVRAGKGDQAPQDCQGHRVEPY